jgi:hypothetical protein
VFDRRTVHSEGVAELLARVSIPRRLEATALVVYAVVFVLLIAFGRPGLGISQGFYLAIVLVALAGGAVSGIAAGVLATLLCAIAAARNGGVFGSTVEPLAIRLAAFTTAGFAVGYFASRGRQMLAESLHVLDEILGLARREVATGAITAEGLHARIAHRAELSWPFAVLVGETADGSDATLRAAMRAIAAAAGPDSDIARVGRARLAVVVPAETVDEAQQAARALELAIGTRVGWALHPQDGDEPLSLFGVASERLQAG